MLLFGLAETRSIFAAQRWRSRDIVLVLSPGVYDGVGLDSWLSSYFSAVTDEASAAICT
jgi:hypothetical protein